MSAAGKSPKPACVLRTSSATAGGHSTARKLSSPKAAQIEKAKNLRVGCRCSPFCPHA